MNKKKLSTGDKKGIEKKLKILILEDSAADAELIEHELKKAGGEFVSKRVETRTAFSNALKSFGPELILADYTLSHFDALGALKLAQKIAPDVPFIVVTGSISEKVAVGCIKSGASDYVLKNNLSLLPHAVRAALKEKESEQKKVAFETALLKAAEEWRATFDAVADAICLLDDRFRIQRCNRAMCRMFARDFKGIIGKPCWEVVHNTRKPIPRCPAATVMKTRRRESYIYESKGIWYEVVVDPIFDSAKTCIGLVYIVHDISERKRAEASLRESEERYRDLVESSQDLIYTHDLEGKLLSVNKIAAQLSGYSIKDLLNMNITALLVPEVRHLFNAYLTGIRTSGQARGRMRIRTAGGENRYWEYSNTLRSENVSIPIVRGLARDITEHEQADKQIRASLLEKEVLLKEIHHRVKNNLQVISGLLTLQAEQMNDERLYKMIKQSQSRIWTMVLIHQMLYQSGNLAEIDMADYIRSLSGNLLSSHAQVAMPPTVSFDLLPIRLAIDKAIPLALIINELVTNAMKHAFPDGRPGEIRISLQECRGTARRAPKDGTIVTEDEGTARRAPTENTDITPSEGMVPEGDTTTCRDKSRLVPTDDKGTARLAPARGCAPTYELIVADNGAGLPTGFDLKKQKNLGLQLVAMLVKQLGGSFSAAGEAGAVFSIVFNDNEKKE